ncbi:MAG TPA: hypothetical protein PKC43_07385 [Phycisphaerales bacterium]|nr:hypothetical protein [Phycisphaerales bacterium]HMP37258.1 hypothetical protein [Phycisphaerales bacterium]
MTRETRKSPAGTEGGHRPTGVPAGGAAKEHPRRNQGRWSPRRKTEIVLRLLPASVWGEPLDALSREASVSTARLAQWRSEALAGMPGALISREPDHRDGLTHGLEAKVGHPTREAGR